MTRICPCCGKEFTFNTEKFKPEKTVCSHCGRKPYALAKKRLNLIRFLSIIFAIGVGILFTRLTENWKPFIRWICGTISTGAIAWGTNALMGWVTSVENIQRLVDREDDFLRKGEENETTGWSIKQ